jgi:hypothetical protein
VPGHPDGRPDVEQERAPTGDAQAVGKRAPHCRRAGRRPRARHRFLLTRNDATSCGQRGIDLGKITELYSNRQPCPACAGKLPEYTALDVKISWAVPYGDPCTQLGRLINRQSAELLADMIRKANSG